MGLSTTALMALDLALAQPALAEQPVAPVQELFVDRSFAVDLPGDGIRSKLLVFIQGENNGCVSFARIRDRHETTKSDLDPHRATMSFEDADICANGRVSQYGKIEPYGRGNDENFGGVEHGSWALPTEQDRALVQAVCVQNPDLLACQEGAYYWLGGEISGLTTANPYSGERQPVHADRISDIHWRSVDSSTVFTAFASVQDSTNQIPSSIPDRIEYIGAHGSYGPYGEGEHYLVLVAEVEK